MIRSNERLSLASVDYVLKGEVRVGNNLHLDFSAITAQ